MSFEDDFRDLQARMYSQVSFPTRRFADLATYTSFLIESATARTPNTPREEIVRRIELALDNFGPANETFALNDIETEVMIRPAFDDIISYVVEQKVGTITNRPMVGTLPFHDPNAFCIQFPDGGVVIAISHGLPQLLNRLAKLCCLLDNRIFEEVTARDLKLTPEDYMHEVYLSARSYISAMPSLAERFVSAIIAFYNGDASNLTPHVIGDSTEDLKYVNFRRSFLIRGAERFIFGHEIAHLILGHLDQRADTVEVAGEAISAHQWDHQQEFEADYVGASWALALANRDWADDEHEYLYCLEAAGSPFFFRIIHILESCAAVVPAAVYSPSSSHPPPLHRLELSQRLFAENNAGPNWVSAGVDTVLRAYWDECGQAIRDLLDKRPST